MKAIILAAGRGTRLGSLTQSYPKSLITVRDRPLLTYTLDILEKYSLEKIVVIGGYKIEKLKSFLSDYPNVQLIENPDYELGNVVSLWQARSELDDDFLLMNADHIYPESLLDKLFEHKTGIVAACDFDRTLGNDDMKVKLNKKTLVAISKKLNEFDGGYIGMTLVRRNALSDYYQALNKTYDKNKLGVVEDILQTLVQENLPPHDR